MDVSLLLLVTLGLLLPSNGNAQSLFTFLQQPQQFQLIRQPARFTTFPLNRVAQPVQFGGFQTLQQNRRPAIQSGALYFSWLDNSLGNGRDFDWFQADAVCKRRGQNLVSIQSLQKSQQINNIITQNRLRFIWTSGQKTRNGGFVWATGQPVQPLNWSSTGRNGVPQPDNREGNENCLGVLNNFYQDGVVWHDVACSHRKPFICE